VPFARGAFESFADEAVMIGKAGFNRLEEPSIKVVAGRFPGYLDGVAITNKTFPTAAPP
jgi:hypothetical protein